MAVKINRIENLSLHDQVVGLFHRLNAATGIRDKLMGVALGRHAILFPNLPLVQSPMQPSYPAGYMQPQP